MKRLLLLAGEESGAIYARRIEERAKELFPGVEVRGYGDYGFTTADLAVFGFWEVLKRIFFFLRVRRTMERAIDEWRPDAVCTVDYPGMNLRLAAYAKSKGIRAVHVVCPQVWAWHRGRIPKIEASLDALCCFFPFEPSFFRAGFAHFVGHPLAEEFAAGDARRGERAGDPRLVALLPGSRLGEIRGILPTLLESVRGLDCRCVIPAANAQARAEIEREVECWRGAGSGCPPVEIRVGGARAAFAEAACAAVASGTATLEAAFAHCPTVLVYRVGRILAFLARRLIKIKHVGLANIVWECCRGGGDASDGASDPLGGYPMLELLQEDMTVKNVRKSIENFISDDKLRLIASSRLAEATDLMRTDGDSISKIVRFLV